MYTSTTDLLDSAVSGTYHGSWAAHYETPNINATSMRQMHDPEHEEAPPPISPRDRKVYPNIVQPKPLRIEEVRPPLLDREWDLGDIKPKRKFRPLPPIPAFYPQPMGCDEAIYSTGGLWHSPMKSPQHPIGTGRPQRNPVGFFGQPAFTHSSSSSSSHALPLPHTSGSWALHAPLPPFAFTYLTEKNVHDDFLDESYEELVGEIAGYRRVMQWVGEVEGRRAPAGNAY